MESRQLRIGSKVRVKGKHDRVPYVVEVIENGVKMFTYRAKFIISCARYEDVIEVIEEE